MRPGEDVPFIRVSVKVYQLLLLAYPSKFRREYGPHMLQVFRDCSRQAYRQRGPLGMLSLWTFTLFDFFSSLVEEHLQRETAMTKDKFLLIGGWALILGGGLYAFSLIQAIQGIRISEAITEGSLVVLLSFSHLFLATGLLAMRVRYAEAVGVGASHTLTAGAAGAGLAALGALLIPSPGDTGFMLWAGGFFTMYAMLCIFGIIGIQRAGAARWNVLAVTAGILSIIMASIGTSGISDLISTATSAIIGGSLALLGGALVFSRRGELEVT
jgi:hypothetical protein